MRILLAYDGSPGAEAALDGLAQAGLPPGTSALVVAVAERDPRPATPGYVGAGAEAARVDDPTMKHARTVASHGAERLRSVLPGAEVSPVAVRGDAAEEIADLAEREGVDLVVVGSHTRHGSGGVPPLGGVARRLVAEADCGVRVGRPRDAKGRGVRVVVGYDGSADADHAVACAAGRAWPPGSTAHLLAAVDPDIATLVSTPGRRLGWADLRRLVADAAERLSAAGLATTSAVEVGDPRSVLVREANRRDADLLVLGGSVGGGARHPLSGSVALGTAARAPCSVEVHRPRPVREERTP